MFYETVTFCPVQIGLPTLIINNAALTTRKSFLEHSGSEISDMFSTNVVGPMFLIMEFLPCLIASPIQNHHIVGISSIVGLLGRPNMVPYSATKFALTGFMEGLRQELIRDGVIKMNYMVILPFLISCRWPR